MHIDRKRAANDPRKAARTLDVLVGRNIKKFRKKNKLTQPELAERLGITFQQIQKYENATNRVSGTRLYLLAEALGVPMFSFFEEGVSPKISEENVKHLTPEALTMAALYDGISKSETKKAVRTILEGLNA